PVVGTKIDLDDGSFHEVDSSEKAFYTAAQGCFREYFKQASPKLLEPIMKMEVECPEDFQGTVVGDIIRRRGIMSSNDIVDGNSIIIAEIPLAETFGYSTDLRSMTQGQGTFTMELETYREVPSNVQTEIIEAKRQEKEAK
ncbi:MAG: elongation factor G, partial [Planctomycetota bacterium]